MARKRLVKGTNAARLEERIARVPADIEPEGEMSIFSAIKELEEDEAKAARGAEPPRPSAAAKDRTGHRPQPRLGPGSFSAAERETIMRCCRDYRNRLPTYLQATRRELGLIDAIIEKCGGSAID